MRKKKITGPGRNKFRPGLKIGNYLITTNFLTALPEEVVRR
jgi:hypothetical protein